MSDLSAMESRVSEVPQYKSMMSLGQGRQQLGQSRLQAGATAESLNNLWQRYGQAMGGQASANSGGQSSFSGRKGALAANTQAGAGAGNQFVSYDYDYDYGGAGAAAGAGGLAGAGNRRFSQYYDYGNYGGVAGSRQYGGSGAGQLGQGYGGGYSPVSVVSGYGPSVCEDKGLNPFLVLATLAGAGLAFFIIYRQITTGGKRNLNPSVTEFFDQAASLLWSGEYKHRYIPILSAFPVSPLYTVPASCSLAQSGSDPLHTVTQLAPTPVRVRQLPSKLNTIDGRIYLIDDVSYFVETQYYLSGFKIPPSIILE